MSASSPHLTSLLRRRLVTLSDMGGCLDAARARLPLWQRVWANFPEYSALMREVSARTALSPDLHQLARHLEAHNCLELELDGTHMLARIPDNDALRQLTGGWLEELGACAVADAGADEVRYGQRILWRRPGDPETYHAEIDVIGRFDDKLLLISCKARRHDALMTRERWSSKKTAEAMTEIDDWADHFGEDDAAPILLTTVDMFDEERRTLRNQALIDKARQLDMTLLPADLVHYELIVERLRLIADQLAGE